MQEHIVKSYDKDLESLKLLLIKLIESVTEQMSLLIYSISNNSIEIASSIIEKDININKLNSDINLSCINIFTLRSPVAYDLRLVFSASHISINLERIGDNIKNVAKHQLVLSSHSNSIEQKFFEMMSLILSMLKNLNLAITTIDVNIADSIAKEDKNIDILYTTICNLSLEKMEAKPNKTNSLSNYLMMSRFLERIGDHIVTITKYIKYIDTGKF